MTAHGSGNPVIVGGVRTPFVRAGGPLAKVPVQELGRIVTRELLFRLDLPPDCPDELIAGNVGCPPDATNVARVIQLIAGMPRGRIAHTVSRNCASGFESVTEAHDLIRLGRANVIVAVGVESLSRAPFLFPYSFGEKVWKVFRAKGAWARLRAAASFRPADLKPVPGLKVGLTDPVSGLIMGATAEKLAREFGISREEQDAYAVESHSRAVKAWTNGRLAEEVTPVYPEDPPIAVTEDIGPRSDTTIEKLARLRPYFDPKYGTVTPGNSSQITDGAVALLVADESTARSLGLTPLGRIIDYAYAGCDPARMGLGPVYATAKLLRRQGLRLEEIDLFEINEAFAAQVLACLKAFASEEFAREQLGLEEPLGEIPSDRLNVNGGAIALGHPVGATGARLILTLLLELRRRQMRLGLATLCVGGGLGGAVLLEAY